MAGGRAKRSSEAIAARILESSGFKVVGFNRKITVDGVEVAEVDIVAEKGGEFYAVEVKAGVADVSSVRQAYVNSLILGMKPMIIARGVDDAARVLARRLGVEVIVMPEELLVTADDLREIVEDAVASALMKLATVLTRCGDLSGDELRILEAVASSQDIAEAAEKLEMDYREVYRALGAMRSRGVLPAMHGYKGLRAVAALLVACSKASRGLVPRP